MILYDSLSIQRSQQYFNQYLNTPPQAGAYKSYAPSLLQMKLIQDPRRDLVSISAS